MIHTYNLRLNNVIYSFLVMRTSGSLKVILNASIVGGMKFGISGENCLRFANIDGIYLVKASPLINNSYLL